ncbi:type IV pilin PilA [[Clostridium] sordellii]|uniref:Type IV pilin PilA n=1 Tax=Paraclostridium sordellii TaxID=1505 RepID=A0ABM9RK21_PARSO|nr:prepilin-type N-terminal cleavage/methylation domain-containing protein [Paeniclostridium sordellii]EPZ53887.1 prepilin-type N-terminal cleavage/methylation domain protein [[Clostridium] sordellii ATCC 9714] [Paeniclostridium sordellii ATCC 9714]MDU6114249.1 prepilin-type N-terminal cleavage/methylation domain-containing protein [Paeniclostridium sordellii]CEJ72326.1 putative type IV pilin PilA [[Clostridium] sordellii] [Paeniclostridium sordellii]CEN70552.1 type IV pilin PilA [[Clostridium]
MKNIKKRINKKRRGFTLIELVMVVAILGTLSSIALVKFTDVGKESKVNSDYITASNIATATKLAINDGVSDITLDKLSKEGYIEGTPKPQSEEGGFVVSIDDGNINVKVGEKVFYPKTETTQ